MRILPLLIFLSFCSLAKTPELRFQSRVIAADLRGGYQVVPADLNKDGKLDLIALASNMTELVWFENPTWERHVIASGITRMINVWPLDTDKDGIPELLLAHAFENEASRSIGIVSLLTHQGDPTKPWTVREIDRLTTSHRIRAANGFFINAPLTGSAATPPDYRDHTPLVAYRPGDYNRRLVSNEDEGVVHGLYIIDWNRDGRDDIVTASMQGIFVNVPGEEGIWRREKITGGSPLPWPKSGASDISVGTLRKERYIASIEPWHGNEVAVYRQRRRQWIRDVIDDSLTDGHTIVTADLNGDGRDEIVAGFRQGKRGVYIYFEEKGKWSKQVLSEGEVAAAACAVLDWNGDRKPDIACIGSATTNLVLYTQQ